MKLFIIFISLALEIIMANTIDGIAIKVNGNIITMHEIHKLQESAKIRKKEAVEQILRDKLRENEIKRLGIKIDDAKLNEEISNIASANNITRDELINALKSQGVDFDDYKNELREHLLNRELMQKILQTNINLANDEDLKKYYDSNQELFTFPTLIKVTSYTSINDAALQQFLSNPLIVNPEVQSKDEEIDIKSLPPQIINIFLNTPDKKFTPVLNSGNTLIVFFIKEKTNKELMPFEEIKPNVMQRYAEAKENELLNEYFDKIKASTKIEYIRVRQ
ncbi:peptidylprolyl isomerase [Helicobacter sp. MIT 99-5507]|uniref:peptidylprolyl isomerase n=1 Tax=Helicobacter sp. MIT 99-5507 TaxID=152489 RepID=UPI000E1E806B|nr:peptidylprolyl isomerase [Helicobacter sp. MIT 99-5507]RDU56576.1 hypothetical protein CQA42_07090 [Helicobacter sp. MIT 99-5507]